MASLRLALLAMSLAHVVSLALAQNSTGGDAVVPNCTNITGWIHHPAECGRVYLCEHGNLQGTFSCDDELVFSMKLLSCVTNNSTDNDCSTTEGGNSSALSVEERCERDGNSVFAHHRECQLYFNCSITSSDHLAECTYPRLFDIVTSQCKDYSDVNCGARVEYVDPCDYRANQCQRTIHCVPCYIRHPSCEGLPDGTNVFVGKEWTPNYVICKDNRTIETRMCENQIFSPVLRQCINPDEVPEEHRQY